MSVNINTTKLKISAENLEKIATDYNNVIENVFSELTKLESSGNWVGDSSNSSIYKYIESIKKEKQIYDDLALNIKKIGTILNEYTTNLETITNLKI